MYEPEPVFLSVPIPMPTLHDLAAHGSRPAPEVEARIRAVAVDESDPYWVHAEVHQTYPDVTLGEVAWVLTHA